MSLGTDLVLDIYRAITASGVASSFPAGIQTAVGNYLSDAEYGEGALTYVSAGVPSFSLPTEGTPAGAATTIATAITNYWMPAGVGVGIAGEPTVETTVVSGTITATTVLTDLTSSLTAIFADVESGQYWTNEEIADHTTITGDALEVYDKLPTLLVLNTTETLWYQRLNNLWVVVTDTKAHSIAQAIIDAVSGVVVDWLEVTPPSSPVAYSGGVT